MTALGGRATGGAPRSGGAGATAGAVRLAELDRPRAGGMKIGSIFSGIGGLELGLEAAGCGAVAHRSARLKALGNAVVPQVARLAGLRLLSMMRATSEINAAGRQHKGGVKA